MADINPDNVFPEEPENEIETISADTSKIMREQRNCLLNFILKCKEMRFTSKFQRLGINERTKYIRFSKCLT